MIIMAPAPLTGVRACVFDAYGTLFDFASAARRCGDLQPDEMAKLTALWRDKQLQYLASRRPAASRGFLAGHRRCA